MKRTALITSIALLTIGVSPAAAEIRQGEAKDPTGDGQTLDITSAHASYDTNGKFSVIVNTATDPKAAGRFFISAKLASFSPPSSCTGVALSAFGFSDSGLDGISRIDGVPGRGTAFISAEDGFTGVSVSDSLLANGDYSCVTVTITSAPDDPAAAAEYDSLDVPIFFDGFGPPKCEVPVLKNKTLAQATPLLSAANCKIGQTKKPKAKLKKGFKLVVSKVVDREDGSNKVDVTLKAVKKK